MKNLTTLAALFFSIFHPAGTSAQSFDTGASTYAVVVGISDYQDKDIPDLRFADRDAEAFANFLRSPAGGSLDSDHLKLLLNSEATQAQFAAALDWLMEVTKEDDEAIIYFSGHGDVEKKSQTQPGFLLCWNAPSKIYMAGGTFALPILQDVISTLSIQNKAKVVVITDACHAGKLSGNEINGAQLTGQNLALQYANEVKILSCQPNEYSIEGEQWGGGRGAFSFNLVNALYGLADDNKDLFVNLQEVKRYLEDHVITEVAPINQTPVVIGNLKEELAIVDSKILSELQAGITDQMTIISPIDSRGMADDLLSKVDAGLQQRYHLFYKSLKDKYFFSSPLGETQVGCAEAYYELLVKEPILAPLYSTLRRNYAAALQDDAQLVLNKWLKTDISLSMANEISDSERLPRQLFTEKVKSFPRYLDRACELLGRENYLYPTLLARKYFFEGYLLTNSNLNPDKALGERALALFRQSLQLQPDQPQVYWQMSNVFGYNLVLPDSAEFYAKKAMELYPAWVLPYTNMAFLLMSKYQLFDSAKPYLEQAMRLEPNSPIVWNSWGVYYKALKDYTKAEEQYKNAIQLDSNEAVYYSNLGLVYSASHRYAEAEQQYKKAIQLDSTLILAYNNLGGCYFETGNYAEAEQQFKKAIQLDSTFAMAHNNLGLVYQLTNRSDKAARQFKKAIQLDSTFAGAYSNLGLIYQKVHQFEAAAQQYKTAIQLDGANIGAYIDLGNVYISTHLYHEAEQQLKKALQLDSTYTGVYSNLGVVCQETGRFAEAEQHYKKAIQLDSAYAFAYNGLGNIYQLTNQIEQAELNYKKAIQLDSTNAAAYNNLGIICKDAHRYTEAENLYKKAIQLNSTFIDAFYNLGVVYLETDRYDEASQQIKKTIQLDSNHINAQNKLGQVYTMTGRFDEAEQQFKKTIQLDSTNATAYYGLASIHSIQNFVDEAFGYLEQALKNGWKDQEWMQNDSFLAPLRKQKKEWKALQKKYFSDYSKD